MKDEPEGALTGYRILDLTDIIGSYCTKLLADLGAEVIKVESPQGDPTRRMPPFAHDSPHIEGSLPFLFRNANKLGITLNLNDTGGQLIFRKLVETVDVVVESNSPGYMESIGFDYSVLKEINPGLIMASITEFGQTGPYKNWKGSPIVDLALSTDLIEAGFPENPPCCLPGMVAYDATSLMAAISIVISLYHRGFTGKGQYIDCSVHESARHAIYPWMPTIHSYGISPDGTAPPPEGRIVATVFPVYPCKDGYVKVMALTPWQWDALVKVLGEPEALSQPEWRDFMYRITNADKLRNVMVEFTMQYTMLELFHAGHDNGVPIAPVLNLSDFVESPQTQFRGFFSEMDHPVIGKFEYPGPPYKWSETSCNVKHSAPCLGEHNKEIYCQRLGFLETEMAALRQAGTI